MSTERFRQDSTDWDAADWDAAGQIHGEDEADEVPAADVGRCRAMLGATGDVRDLAHRALAECEAQPTDEERETYIESFVAGYSARLLERS